MTEMKSAVRRYLSNHRTSAEVISRTMGPFTKPIRKTNVAMFHIGRCGSTAVGILLNQHPKIRWGAKHPQASRESTGETHGFGRSHYE